MSTQENSASATSHGRVNGKIAVVTGGALGMGRAFSLRLAEEGAAVVVSDINADEGHKVVAEIEAKGGRAQFVELDVACEEAWTKLADLVERTYGKADILVNNAGIYLAGTTERTDSAAWDKTFAINAKGVFLGSRALIPLMRKGGGGSIINISSNWGIVGFPDAAAYVASKGAVRLLTKATASEVAKDGIRVNSVHPSLTITHLSKDIVNDPVATKALLGPSLLGRPAQAEEIANGVLFLASDESAYMTGSELVMDGGYLAT
ncbi:glucose 1-dehydrogenase [Kaistia dalseonensis]|uniref:Cyclopentanol dehydrogenase n=1 Tax=Kaistia dalseonensis TaxID=410840 RepID=A0ABU0H0S7_9HYPH|nr:glucose 1-dehydrogenase [Kaistia dalseonensis]MCX5493350.1 glucose 1-dehydrogenase [Kaistia dalseonensis]MDQ0435908.1 cyclopentanol dehydrogenase [Kaistia dalseonensis]